MTLSILATDVHYHDDLGTALAAGVLFSDWEQDKPDQVFTTAIDKPAGYVPGLFFQRELPCLQKLIAEHKLKPDVIIVDGFVHLAGGRSKGLGAHLFDARGGKTPVIGVAKSAFNGIDDSTKLLRGGSERPLFVTAAGVELEDAKALVARMHGKHRIPTLLTAVDHACRGWPL